MAAAALDVFKYQAEVKRNFTARLNRTSTASGQQLIADGPKATSYRQTITHDSANNVAGGGDIIYSDVVSISAGGTATFDLRSFTDVVNRTTNMFARVKSFYACLLSTTQDTAVGTNCSGVVIGNAATNANKLWMGAQDETVALVNGGEIYVSCPNAAGWTTDSSHKDILFTNSDGSVAAKVYLEIVGGSS